MSKFPENTQLRTSVNFSRRLKFLMEESDCISNKQFAEFVGVSTPVISKAVNFGIVPSTRMLIKIANKLELSLLYLLGENNDNNFIATACTSTFHNRLCELTKEKNMNYSSLASKMDFPRTYIYEWIKENTLPSIDYIFELANYFNVSSDYLLGRTDYRK